MSELADQWHMAVCTELESRVKNRDFFVWVTVEPGEGATAPEDVEAEHWAALGDDVAAWLDGMSVEAVDAENPPTHEARVGAARVGLVANPKKPNRRGTDPLILNLYPGMTYFEGSYSASPAPQLPEDPEPAG